MDGSGAQHNLPSVEAVFPNARSVEGVFEDFKGRRTAIIKALTTDVEEFYQQCNPERENLCLYGFPNEKWIVKGPDDDIPPDLPEPTIGINYTRDSLLAKRWLFLVAVHSYAWLLSVAFYFAGKFSFDQADRNRLFMLINDLPTLSEVVTETAKEVEEKLSVLNLTSSKSKSGSKGGFELGESSKQAKDEEEEEEEEEEKDEDKDKDEDEESSDSSCGACGEFNIADDDYFVFCDTCDKWYHSKCVNITRARAKQMEEQTEEYKCPSCSNNVD